MRKVTVYNRLFAENKEENELVIESLSKFKNPKNGLSWFEHYILFALLYQPDIEKIELEANCGKSKHSKYYLRTDFRITFVDSTVRRLEANGAWHFFGRDFQSDEEYKISWDHVIQKQQYCKETSEFCLSVNDLISRRNFGLKKNSISDVRNQSFLKAVSNFRTDKTFRKALTKLKNSTDNITLSICSSQEDLIIPKWTKNKAIDNIIKESINNSTFKVWIE